METAFGSGRVGHHPSRALRRSCSDLSRNSGISKLAKALDREEEESAARAEEEEQTRSRFVLKEESLARRVWSTVVMLFLLYTSTIFLYRFAFYRFHIGPDGPDPLGEDDVGWAIADVILSLLFWMDLVMNFFISYQDDKGNEVVCLKLIARKYLRFYFWINLLACLPEYVLRSILEMTMPAVRVNRLKRTILLARLVRIPFVTHFMQVLSTSSVWRWVKHFRRARAMNFIIGLFWVLHILACGWYLCAALHDDTASTWVARSDSAINGSTFLEQPPFEQWNLALVWVFCMLFMCMGIEDIASSTLAERIYTMCTMLLGAVVGGIIIGAVTSIVTSKGETEQAIEDHMHLIETYSAHTDLDPQTVAAMKSEMTRRVKHDIQRNYNKAEIQEMLTSKYMTGWLLSLLPERLFSGKLRRNNILCGLQREPALLPSLLAMHLLRVDYDVREVIYRVNDLPISIFIVLSGTFACVGTAGGHGGTDAYQPGPISSCSLMSIWSTEQNSVENEEEEESNPQHLYPYRLFSHNTYFGAHEMIVGRLRNCTMRCERSGTVLALGKSAFDELQDMFPQFGSFCAHAARRRERFRIASLARLKVGLPLRHFAALRIQQIFRDVLKHRGRGGTPKNLTHPDEIISSAVTVNLHALNKLNSMASADGGLDRTLANLRSEFGALREELRTNGDTELHREVANLRSDFSAFRDELRCLLQATPPPSPRPLRAEAEA